MKVLVINSGSSSLKYQLMDMHDESVLAKGVVERIGMADVAGTKNIIYKRPGKETVSCHCHRPPVICFLYYIRFK